MSPETSRSRNKEENKQCVCLALVQLVIELVDVESREQSRLLFLNGLPWQAVPDWGRSSRETSTANGGGGQRSTINIKYNTIQYKTCNAPYV